jgi:hypothetical protein
MKDTATNLARHLVESRQPMRYLTCGAVMLVGVFGCASAGAGAGAQGVDAAGNECGVQLEPRQAGPERPPVIQPTRTAPVSQIVVHAQVPLAPLRQQLEKQIPTRLAEGRVGIGPGGKVRYWAERGGITLSVTRSALVIETPVRAHAEACRGDDCYASCEPLALARAEVPLMLDADYRFLPSSVTLRFTRGCKVRALAGFLTIDVTPTLEAELAPELAKAAREIDRQLPDVKREVEKAWAELDAPRSLPVLGCLVLEPSGVVQGPLSPSSERLRVRFALLATPELRSACPQASMTKPLPPLQSDPALPEEGALQLGMVTPLDDIARAFETAAPFVASEKRLRVSNATATAQGRDLHVELALAGDVCGNVALEASPDFAGAGQFIGLSHAKVAPADQQRLEQADLDSSAFAVALQSRPRLAPLLSVAGFRESVPALAASLSQRGVKLSAQVSSTGAAGATARGAELVAWLRARGSLALELTDLGQGL